jgi:uncharacterized membrane protein
MRARTCRFSVNLVVDGFVDAMPKNRLEAFSDCVMAFAITLLILEIRVPDLGSIADSRAMLKAILALVPRVPSFVVYVISFVVCTVWWISHHAFIHDLHSVDRPLLWANSLFLMWIAFMPFPTGCLDIITGQAVATAFDGLACTLTGFSFWLMRWYASVRSGLMNADIDRAVRVRRVRISLFSPVLYLAGAGLSLRYPMVGLCTYVAIPAYFAFGNLGHQGSSKKVSPASAVETDSGGKIREPLRKESTRFGGEK